MKVNVLRNLSSALVEKLGLNSGALEGKQIECEAKTGEALCKLGLGEIVKEAPKEVPVEPVKEPVKEAPEEVKAVAPAPAIAEKSAPAVRGSK